MSDLSGLRFNWDELARRDAFGAVLTHSPDGRPWNEAAFFASGERFVAEIADDCARLRLPFGGARALDFGCGLGRLSRPLAKHFEHVDAVDLSAEMLVRARSLAGPANVRFLHARNGSPDVVAGERYAFVLCHLVLQHVPPGRAVELVERLARALAPGGVALVQAPLASHTDLASLDARIGVKGALRALAPHGLLERYRCWRNGRPRMDMFGIARADVEAAVARAGARVVAAVEHDDTHGLVESLRYFVRREGTAEDRA